MEFIESNSLYEIEDSAVGIEAEMKKYKDALVELIGQEKYEEELGVIGKMLEQERNKGAFQAQSGDVDKRDEKLRDIKISSGFDT